MDAFIFLLGIAGFGYWVYWLISNRCDNCGKFGALRKEKSELISSQPTKIKEVLKRYNKKGEITSKREVLVDGMKKTYRLYYKCKDCHHITIKTEEVSVKN